MKKTSLFTILALLLTFVLAGCSGGGDTPAANDDAPAEATQEEMDAAVEKIKEKGELVLATSADYPPYEWHLLKDGKDEIVGFDIEIAKALADSMGVKLTVKDLDFEGIIPSISTGQADIGIAGLSATPERRNAVSFTIPYYENNQVILVKKDVADQYNGMEDFAGKKVGAQTGSVQETTIKENFPKDVELLSLSRLNNLVLEVKNGTADGLVISRSSGAQYAQQNPELVSKKIDIPDEPGVCIALNKDNKALTAYFNQELKKLIDDGQIEKWIVEYEQLASESAGAEGAEAEGAGEEAPAAE
ncbi:polar amino acid transport system substrate-binding protein [Peptoniphilus ivorii]|uniref:transporter substrate-binding domain-containing protein n=1 Tax=Aedoeadaptatus ivorii TaxID=54006 RepID=UPI0027801A59|nr:transporter substrate-binding domain-containing protein [Peptoniphilus ivorii]MDQ0508101.1 polar amino acid transport system substrate-binding protein [Peptoniphilus ivorii]